MYVSEFACLRVLPYQSLRCIFCDLVVSAVLVSWLVSCLCASSVCAARVVCPVCLRRGLGFPVCLLGVCVFTCLRSVSKEAKEVFPRLQDFFVQRPGSLLFHV